MSAGCLYLVPVPIGNLGDITLRAMEVLKNAGLIAAEDTRKTRFLLSQYQIKAPRLISLHKYNEKQRLAEILAVLEQGTDVAVVTDAGTPGISDPALFLIQSAINHDIKIVPLPGATALIPALTASGLDCGEFMFLGFLPLKQKDRRKQLQRIKESPCSTVIYEAPHRVKATLGELFRFCGNRRVCIAREISKMYEEFIRGDLRDMVGDHDITEKGEFVIVIESAGPASKPSESQIRRFIESLADKNLSSRSLAGEVASHFGLNRNEAYQFVLEYKESKK